MAQDTPPDQVTAAYYIPAELKARIERIARDEDLNASQVVRRILRDYFEREDARPAPADTLPTAA